MIEVEGYFWPDDIRDKDIIWALKHTGAALSTLQYSDSRETIIQAGGCIGLYPIKQAQYFNHVITLEPCPKNVECIQRNISRSQLRNITLIPAALGSHVGFTHLSTGKYSTKQTNLEKTPGSTVVPMTTIDAITEALGFMNISAIQLDLEGSEYSALLGAKNTIEKYHPTIQLERSDEERRDPELDNCFELLKTFGYKIARKVAKDVVYVLNKDMLV